MVSIISAAKLTLLLFCFMQDSQQWLGRLIPDKQNLNDQLKQVQQNSLHRESCVHGRHSTWQHKHMRVPIQAGKGRNLQL